MSGVINEDLIWTAAERGGQGNRKQRYTVEVLACTLETWSKLPVDTSTFRLETLTLFGILKDETAILLKKVR